MLRLRDALHLDFDADEFHKLPRREQREICIRLAERAQAMAEKAQKTSQREILLNIASLWLHLADLTELH